MNVQIAGVSVDLGGRRLVHDVTLDVPSGSTVGVVGPNGSGKSTLLRTVYRDLEPSTGVVLIDGCAVSARSLLEHARTVAAVAQQESLELDFTVREVVGLGRHPHPRSAHADEAAIRSAMRITDIDVLADRSVLTLSGGERQRVMIARALAQDTPVVVLDEPTNHLDLRHQLRVVARIAASTRTVLVALHDLNLASSICDQIVVMQRGRVVANGDPATVLDPDLVEHVYGTRPALVRHPVSGRPQFLFTPDLQVSPDERHDHVQPRVPS